MQGVRVHNPLPCKRVGSRDKQGAKSGSAESHTNFQEKREREGKGRQDGGCSKISYPELAAEEGFDAQSKAPFGQEHPRLLMNR